MWESNPPGPLTKPRTVLKTAEHTSTHSLPIYYVRVGELPVTSGEMGADVFEESLRLPIGILEALPVASSQDRGYPFPQLVPTGLIDEREFGAVVLDNPFLRVTVVPGLGGRILRVYDKRTSAEILPVREALLAVAGGPRGAMLPDGIQFRLGPEDRLNALGSVAFQLDPAQAEEEDAGVWLSESAMCRGLSWHLRISVPPDRAEIHVLARVLNRTDSGLSYNAGLTLDQSSWGAESPRGEVVFARDSVLSRFADVAVLGPRQVDSWSVKLAPVSGLSGSTSLAGALEVGSNLRIQVTRPFPGAKVLLLTATDETLEAPLDLYPELIKEVPFNGPSPKAVVVRDSAGVEVLRWPSVALGAKAVPPYAELEVSAFSMGTRHLAFASHAIEALAAKDFATADAEFEQALLYNGDDPLLWWAKAVTQRKLGVETELVELPNAHYLAPLEPALRAEAFLSQSSHQGREGNPLVKSLSPEDLIEVACLLLEHRLPDEATRWINEALRHHDLAMLHYLQADMLMEGTRMATEAAQHVMLGGRAQVPPYPWRAVELAALSRLHGRFPEDAALAALVRL